MDFQNFLARFSLNSGLVDKLGFNPYYPAIQSALVDPIILNGTEFINLASNNYLGLADEPRIKEAAKKAIDEYGLSFCATPIAGGACSLYQEASQRLNDFTGVEDSILYPSCYQANNAVFKVLAGPVDVILADHFAHSSLIEGIKSSTAKFRPFLHNNLGHLEDNLKKCSSHEQIFVVTESVFSTEGTLAPLAAMNNLCLKYNAILVIDDSHGIGLIGPNGRGAAFGLENFHGIYTASLGKAIANAGGMIGGNKKIIDFIRYNSSHLIYSTAIVPPVLGGIIKSIEIIEAEFESLSRKIFAYKKIISDALVSSGFHCTASEAPIMSIKAGSSEQTLLLAQMFFDNNILTTPFIYPSVPEKQGKIRLIAGANLKQENIEKAAAIIHSFKKPL